MKKPIPKRPCLPSDTEVNALLALYNGRRYAEAESQTRALLEKFPGFAFGWKLLGGILQMQGKDALPAFQKVTELTPSDPEAHYNLGVILKGMGRLEDAAASYRKAIALNPDYAEAHGNLGNTLKDLGQLDAAIASYRRALAIRPDSAVAHNNLGTVLKDRGNLGGAVNSYRRALQLKPDYAEAHSNLGNVLKYLGKFSAAAESCRKAIELKPDYAEAHSNLGFALKELCHFDAALISYRRALEIAPENVAAMLGISEICVVNGEIKQAEEGVRKALEIEPDNLEARFLLTTVRKTKAGDENLAALLAVEEAARISQSPMQYQQAISLHFVLGRCLDDIGEHDRAFPYFLEGNRLKRATFEYSAADMTEQFNSIMRVFDQTTIERLRGGSNSSTVPIFVLGMPRSGTTLVEQIIASHPKVYGAGELRDISTIIQREVGGAGRFPDNVAALDRAGLAGWADDYVAGLCRREPEAQHITDKMPDNFQAIGLIHLMLPNAKIIHINRNPMDTCLSCFTKLFSGSLKPTYDLSELGQYYVDYVRLMEHWRKVLPAGAFLDVQYEEVVADLETEARRIIDFCDMEWNDACVDFHKHKRSIGTASTTQVRQPIYKSSVERWRAYEKFLGPLLDALGELAGKRN